MNVSANELDPARPVARNRSGVARSVFRVVLALSLPTLASCKQAVESTPAAATGEAGGQKQTAPTPPAAETKPSPGGESPPRPWSDDHDGPILPKGGDAGGAPAAPPK